MDVAVNETTMQGSFPRLPTALAGVLSRLPPWPGSRLFCTGLNVLMRPHLPADIAERLEGRALRIQVADAGLAFDYTWRQGAFYPLSANTENPDLILKADVWAFYQLLQRKEDPDTLFFNRRLSIEGDTELGLMVKNTLDSLDPDLLHPRAVIKQGQAALQNVLRRPLRSSAS